jgi:hypothetical protein
MATKARAATKQAGATEKQASDSTKFTFDPKAWPMGTMVKYTGTRNSEHTGQQGPIVGYRPTSGLWVKFPNGRGSISVKQTELVSKGGAKAPAKGGATPAKPAKAAKAAKPAKPKDTPAEPAKTA